MDQKKVSIAFIITFPFIVTYFHHWVLKELPFHTVFEELYYIPLFFGALFFGLKGALITYLYVSALYLPYFFGLWTVNFLGIIDFASFAYRSFCLFNRFPYGSTK